MTGIIYGNTRTVAEKKLDEMIIDWTHLNYQITRIKRSPSGSTIVLNNKESWKTIVPSSGFCRGACCNVALIDKNIPQEIVEQIIMPCVTARPWPAVGYY